MSDNSNSTGSSASSTNSWTLLSPEEAAVENVGPVDDGTESLGDVPSLSEELAGAAVEFKSGDLSVETVLSEEGHQVCQETSPESSEGPLPSSPSRLSPLPHNPLDAPDLDLESQPPVIHEIDTSSPCSDNELLGAIPFVTNIDLGAPLDIPAAELPPAEFEESCSAPPLTDVPVSAFPELDTPAELEPTSPPEESPVIAAEPEVIASAETDAVAALAADPPSDAPSLPHVVPDTSYVPETTELPSTIPEIPVTEEPADESPEPATAGAVEAEEEEQQVEEKEEEEEVVVEEEATETWESSVQDQRGGRGEEEAEEEHEPGSDAGGFDEGLRRRNVPSFEPLRLRTSDEEDEDEELEFQLAPKKEKPWFSVNKCIVGALILLFLGSLFLAGDFDESDPADEEQSQDWLSADPQDMKELQDKLTQENQHIAVLEAQLQAQKLELDSALNAVAMSGDEEGKADLELENTKLKEELSSLPELKTELESLRARVTELTQLTVAPTVPPAPQPKVKDAQGEQPRAGPEKREGLKEELQRQKLLLEESRKRLEGMKRDVGSRKHVRDNLQEIQEKISEQVESWGKKKSPQDHKWKGNKGKGNERDHWKKEEKKERKHGKEGGWKEKEEKKREEWKPQKHNSHKEAWRKHQDEWERKKGERRTDREERRKEKPWHSHEGKKHHDHHHHHHHHHHDEHQHHHQPRQAHQYNHNDFWRDQEQKLQRNFKPQLGCSSVDDCAGKEGLYAVELPEFEELLEGYLSKLEGSSAESKDKVRKLTADFFEDGVFVHDRVRFGDFAEDVADILEDMVDVLEGTQKDSDSLEEEMEEFEREALWKFAATA